ncbi:beta strand repeat-containing protein, partial [Flavobacterium sp. W22_SRS_FP1]|uniref:beta strand repeat-containing protein n=1 Tax=Flavobacterium sp. W22_SRS_FP1 TaxID=3240276 RepID=UPI003F920D17
MTSKILKLAMALLLLFTYSFASAQNWPPMGSRINGENSGDYFGSSVSISADGSILASGAPENDDNGNRSGQVRIFQLNGTDWTQLGNTLVGSIPNIAFGSRVSVSEDGTLVAVGAPFYNTSNGDFSGQVQVFKNINGTWSQIGTDLFGEGYTHYFGWNLKLSGDGNRLLVSSYNAPGVNGNGTNGFGSGMVYAYEYDTNSDTWTQLGTTIQGPKGAKLGYSLDIDYDGSHIAAGGYAYIPYQGIVQTFTYNSTNWVQTGSNLLGDTTDDSFGSSVSLSSDGTRLAVGSTGANGYVGNAKTFDFDSNTNDWVQVGSVLPGLVTSNYYGSSVSLTSDGNKLAVGGTSGAGDNGYIRIFDFDSNTNDWVQDGNDLLGAADDLFFGSDVNFNNDGSVLATSTPYTSLGDPYSSEGGVTVFGNSTTTTTLNAGTLWTSQTSAADNQWRGVTYGNGLYVAVASSGTGNRVMTSPDAIAWTTQNAAADNTWRDVTYGNGLFVAISASGSSNRVMTSPDGINWTSRTSAADNLWNRVTYGNGLFVAVAANGANRVMTSPDGITWTARNAAAFNVWNDVVYGNGLFVAVSDTGISNRVMTSPDGITWTSRTSAADNSWNDITYGNGLFVAVAQSGTGNRVMTSPDGISWTAQLSAEDNTWTSVTYGNGLFVAVAGSGSNRVMTSPDGVTWTAHASAASNGWISVIYENNMFVAVSLNGTGNRVMTSKSSTAAPSPTIIPNRSLNFDATAGQTVDINPMIPYTSSYTVMGWVNITGSFSNIFTWGSPTTNNYVKIETNFSGKLRYYVPSGGAVVESTTIIKNSGWVHIAITNNAGSITLYVNGVAENTGNETRIITPTTSSMGAALLNGSIQGSNNGTIDELSIWNSALTSVDINNFMTNSPDGNETGVMAFYDFNNPYIAPRGDNTSVSQAITLTDVSGNGYTGTLSSFSLNGATGNWVEKQIPVFTSCSGTASAEQTFTLSGTDLTNDVIVTTTTGFEVSLTPGSGFASSVSITASGSLSATTVYIRVTSLAATGAIYGTLTTSSVGATDRILNLAGIVNSISLTAASQTNVSCNSGSDGSATVSVSGASAGYSYSWAPSGGIAATASGLSAGTYTVTVTDASSCTATQSFTITQPAALIATASAQTNVSCNSGSNGSATVSVSGGTAGYTYSWAPSGGTAATASGLSAGTYTVTVTDANSCTATQNFTITQPTALVATVSAQTNVSCNSGSNGSATVSVSGGTAG